MTSRILVTGGCGFLGSWTVHGLVEAGYSVRVFDLNINTDMLEFVMPGLSEKLEFVLGDITDTEKVKAAAKDCTGFVHLAGVMTVDCQRDPIMGARINVLGGLNVFEAARLNGITCVVYVSTAGIFGRDDGINPRPESHYGAFKLAIEGSARAYWLNHEISSIGFRPYIIYGPGAGSGLSAGPSIACRAAYQGQPAEIGFSGDVGLVYVQDVAHAFVSAIEENFEGALAANLCGENASIDQFVGLLTQQVPGANITVTGEPFLISAELPDHNKPKFIANLKVTSVETGIAATLTHYASRPSVKPDLQREHGMEAGI